MPQFVNKWFPKHPSKDNYLTLTLFATENKMCTAPMPQSHDEIGVKSSTIVSAIPFTVALAAPLMLKTLIYTAPGGSAHNVGGKGCKARGSCWEEARQAWVNPWPCMGATGRWAQQLSRGCARGMQRKRMSPAALQECSRETRPCTPGASRGHSRPAKQRPARHGSLFVPGCIEGKRENEKGERPLSVHQASPRPAGRASLPHNSCASSAAAESEEPSCWRSLLATKR